MDIVFVDTSIFESENFIEGAKLKQLIELGMKGIIKILVPEITYNEVKARILKKLKEIKPLYEKNYKNCSILRNSDNYENAFSLRRVDVEQEYGVIIGKFDEILIEGKVEIINYPTIDIGNVFKRYFSNEFPFKEGNKKYEFPDAFAIETMEQWCIINKEKCLTLSLDKDILNYKTPNLIPIEDFKSYINKKVIELQKREKHEEKLKLINDTYVKFTDVLKIEVINELESICLEYLKFRHDGYRFDSIDDMEILECTFSDYSINFIRENSADIELNVAFTINAKVIYDDYGTAWCDKEDNHWYGIDVITEEVSERVILPVSIEVEFSPLSGQEFAFAKLKEINNNRSINL
ncbi:PIN domain-containing protein [Arcicella sp. LKC2W]|uniref:PIN domain-containing protein n=1 Tax=Arcicella sp. LKC2W TaxID=2984198 RepID=UPI002B1F0997|nr:PIN domain-containing protein [Arcicella sp. LKC2W]MEA5461963.1 PIN domain-containing protein [Arcicella sp. LKC2W]